MPILHRDVTEDERWHLEAVESVQNERLLQLLGIQAIGAAIPSSCTLLSLSSGYALHVHYEYGAPAEKSSKKDSLVRVLSFCFCFGVLLGTIAFAR